MGGVDGADGDGCRLNPKPKTQNLKPQHYPAYGESGGGA